MTRIITIRANKVRAGDLLAYGDRWHRITEIIRCVGGSWPIAADGTGWAIALGDRPVRIRRGWTASDRLVGAASAPFR